MPVSVNGLSGSGTLVAPLADSYKITATNETDSRLIIIESCHREHIIDGAKSRIEFEYRPVKNLESSGYCPLRIGSYDQKRGRHYWTFIDFESKETTLPAIIRCSGSETKSNGVSICQSRAGLVQEIEFESPVVFSPPTNCSKNISGNDRSFRFEMSPRECVYNFIERAEPHREHRLTSIGYEQILMKE
jgi:hypothetical protein